MQFLYAVLKDLSIDLPSIVVFLMIELYNNSSFREKLIYPVVVPKILRYVPSHFKTKSAIGKDTIARIDSQLGSKKKKKQRIGLKIRALKRSMCYSRSIKRVGVVLLISFTIGSCFGIGYIPSSFNLI